MELKIKYNGKKREYFIDGIQKSGYIVSRLLTNTITESGVGIFTDKTEERVFNTECHKKIFTFKELPNIKNHEEYKNEIMNRITEVRNWTKSFEIGEIIMDV